VLSGEWCDVTHGAQCVFPGFVRVTAAAHQLCMYLGYIDRAAANETPGFTYLRIRRRARSSACFFVVI
jgi:hypothetical protein